MFHLAGGFYFERIQDGRIRLSVRVPIAEADGEWKSEQAVVHVVVVEASALASAIASVSPRGETAATHRKALDVLLDGESHGYRLMREMRENGS